MIDKAYATNCNRSEESRASRIAARRRGQPFKSYHYTWLFISDFEGFGRTCAIRPELFLDGLCRFSLYGRRKQER